MGNACTTESGAAQQGGPVLAALARKDAEARAMREELERLHAVVERGHEAAAAVSGAAPAGSTLEGKIHRVEPKFAS